MTDRHGNPRLLTINEAAEEAHISRRTLYNWIAQGKVAYTRTAGGTIRILAESLFQGTPRKGYTPPDAA